MALQTRSRPASPEIWLTPTLSYRGRAFLFNWITVCLAISLTFLASNAAIRLKIRSGIELTVHQTEASLERERTVQNRRATQLLTVLAENSPLGASLRRDPMSAGTLQGVQRKLERLNAALGLDLIAISDERGQVIASVPHSELMNLDSFRPDLKKSGLQELNGTLYETMTAPISIGSDRHGLLTAGTKFQLSSIPHFQFSVLLHGNRVIRAMLPAAETAAIEQQLRPRCLQQGCEIWLSGEDYLVIPTHSAARAASLGGDYQLLGFQSIDRATEGFTQGLKIALMLIAGCGLLVASCMSALASRAVSKPLSQLMARLETSESTHELQPDFPTNSPTREINQLAACFNRAARAVQHSKHLLGAAYLEFLETMAQALDARDPYTSGHSNRVSAYAAAMAADMGLPAEEIETIRIGAQLHDIGKIGVPDAVLGKAGALTSEEFELIKLHPQIGKKILERVAQFERYLPIVELHHEDLDGSGYPYGLKGEEIPLAVRIVHVADVFDALTSDRAYRKAMTSEQAFDVLRKCCNSHFDPDVVRAFMSVVPELLPSEHAALIQALS